MWGPTGSVAAAILDQGVLIWAIVSLVGLLVASVLVTTVSTFFSAAFVHCTAAVLRGGNVSIRAGLGAAWRTRRKILVWGVVAGTAAVVVRVLESWSVGEQMVASWFGFAWSVLTYFVVPVLVLEDLDVRETVRESGRTFAETWGETASANVGATLFLVAGMLAATVVLSVGFVLAAGSPSALAILTLVFFAFFLLQFPAALTLGAVVKTALYLYAREGEMPATFDDVNVADAVA